MSKNLKTVLAIVVILLLGASVGFAVKNSNGGSKNAQVAGPRGETGSVGPSGLKGEKGDIGPIGPKGDSGVSGARGANGSNGSQGAAGAQGPAGPQGATGPQGPSGSATCPNGPCLSLQSGSPGTQETGNINISGTLIAGNLQGSGTSVTGVNAAQLNGQTASFYTDASNISSGTLSDTRLSANVGLLNANQIFTGTNNFKNSADSSSAFQIQNVAGGTLFYADTTDGSINIGVPGADFTDDFESGDMSAWDTVNSMNVDTARSFSGTYSAKSLSSGTTSYAIKNITAASNLTFSTHINIDSTSNDLDLLVVNTAGNVFTIYRSNGSNILCAFKNYPGPTTNCSSTALADDTWATLELSLSNGPSGVMSIYLDGNLALSWNADNGTLPFTQVEVGNPVGGRTGTVYFDDVEVGTPSSLSPILNVNGDFNAFGTSTFKGLVTVRNSLMSSFQVQNASGSSIFNVNTLSATITINGNLGLNGHLISGNKSGTTTIAAGAAANCSGSASVSLSGNDTSGTVTITSSTGTCPAGILATVTFANNYASAPRVTLTPANGSATTIQYFSGASSTSDFTIDTNNSAATTTTYKYNYFVTQ